jgi:hypothetical protein
MTFLTQCFGALFVLCSPAQSDLDQRANQEMGYFFGMNENCRRKCSGFCFDQVDACLKIAQLDLSPKHRASFLRTADHWKALANACDGELHPWKSWCYPDTSPGSNICVNVLD